jgi:glutathione S-transferase/3-isopropylmalate dehydratase
MLPHKQKSGLPTVGHLSGPTGLVIRSLPDSPFHAGDRFTAADIPVGYALLLGLRTGNYVPGSSERDYLARITARPAYTRAMEICQATKAWAARSPGLTENK